MSKLDPRTSMAAAAVNTPTRPVLESPAAAKKPASTPAPPLERERRFLMPTKKGAHRKTKSCQAARDALRASQVEFFRKEMIAASTGTGEEQLGQDAEERMSAPVAAGARLATSKKQPSTPVAPLPLEPERRFLRPKKKKGARWQRKSRETAREALRASQAEFFRGLIAAWRAEEQLEKEAQVGKPVLGPAAAATREQGPQVPGGREEAALHARVRAHRAATGAGAALASSGQRRTLGRNISESLRSSCNRKLKVTSQHPFKLRTEQRGKIKEQQFIQKLRELRVQEKKMGIHVAQRLPWTTDEPDEFLIKPGVKKRTEPIDFVLHSDVRALGRAEYDKYVLERNEFPEQQRLEWRRQQELEEEERIRKLRRTELILKAA